MSYCRCAEDDYWSTYEKMTEKIIDEYGCSISCKKGLWSVSAATEEEAECEAQRYFALYFLDGDYGDANEKL